MTFALGAKYEMRENQKMMPLTSSSNTQSAQTSSFKNNNQVIDDKQRTYFVQDILPTHPTMKDKIHPQNVVGAIPFQIKDKHTLTGQQGWIVETNDANQNFGHFLLTPTLQKELIDFPGENGGSLCHADSYRIVGQEPEIDLGLKDPQGYLALSGECDGQFVSSFTSLYKISTGEKISLVIKSEPSPVPQLPGIDTFASLGFTDSGVALGKMRGIFGGKNPILVVEYLQNSPSQSTTETVNEIGGEQKLGELQAVAFFDVQTGKLVHLQRLK
jgi:hypothetical protein